MRKKYRDWYSLINTVKTTHPNGQNEDISSRNRNRCTFAQVPPHQTQDESVQRHYVVFPDHVVEYLDALVELRSAG